MSDHIERAIRQRNLHSALRLMLEGNPPRPRLGFSREGELWDYKRDCPRLKKSPETENAWASIAADVLAFHNHRGGIIFFGIEDKTFDFSGATSTLDSKIFNDRIRRYLPDKIFVDYSREFIQHDQRYLGVALIPPRGPLPERFRSSAPEISGKKAFEKNGTARRAGDSTLILTPGQADAWERTLQVPTLGNLYSVNEEHFRILEPEYREFIGRDQLRATIQKSLEDPRVATTSLVGVGGMGKTALATWAALYAYNAKKFDFIVSMTAKDRELTSTGIIGLPGSLGSFDRLLDEILDVLQFPDLKDCAIEEKEREVRILLESGSGLLYVDNLETVDDVRIIQFLEDLPFGTHALVTSRRSRVRVSARPLEVPSMSDREVEAFVLSLTKEPNFSHLAGMRAAEAVRVGTAWNSIPLAIKWSMARSSSVNEAIARAESATATGRDGDALLEFCFRRVFDDLLPVERRVLQSLSILQQPIPVEAVVASTESSSVEVVDALDELVSDALVVREFDPDRNDYCYTVLPITRSFVQHDMRRDMANVRQVTKRLRSWFEASDVRDSEARIIVRDLRQGGKTDVGSLIDLASAAERDKKLDHAESLLRQALGREPRSWRAAKALAEFLRHKRGDIGQALRYYTVAVANAPSRGPERALIFREYGILVRESAEPNALDRSIEALRTAVIETPNDLVAVGALAQALDKKGISREIIRLLEPHLDVKMSTFRRRVDPILLTAYERTHDILKAATLRQRLNSQSKPD